MADSISLEIITHDGLIFQADVYSITLPTPEGQIGILPHHEPLVALIVPGVITIHHHIDKSDTPDFLATAGGFVEIDGKAVRLLADSAIHSDNIDELKIKESLAKAEEMKKTAADDVSFADAVGQVDLNLASLRVANLRRRHRRTL